MDAQKMKVILGKCKGGDVEIVDCFSMDYERWNIYIYIYIYILLKGLLTCKSFLFCFVNLWKESVFLLVMRGS